jgi:Zn-finger nucleic acid-binding protein
MYCPVCKDKELVMSERQSIEIDYCPACRGVWLDRGELDKIVEHAKRELAAVNVQPMASARPAYRSGHHEQGSQSYDHRYRPKKKESFWQELFD